MKLPPYVAIVHRTFRVVELDEDLRYCVSDDGLIDFEHDTITVNPCLSPAQVLETLLHEVGHAVHAVAAINDHSSEEEIVSRTTPIWMAVWRDNPLLLDLLCEWADG